LVLVAQELMEVEETERSFSSDPRDETESER